MPYMVSMGMYVMEPRALAFIEPNQRLDLPELVARLLAAGEQSAPTSTTATGSTSAATRTTRRRSSSSSRLRPLLMADTEPTITPVPTAPRPPRRLDPVVR